MQSTHYLSLSIFIMYCLLLYITILDCISHSSRTFSKHNPSGMCQERGAKNERIKDRRSRGIERVSLLIYIGSFVFHLPTPSGNHRFHSKPLCERSLLMREMSFRTQWQFEGLTGGIVDYDGGRWGDQRNGTDVRFLCSRLSLMLREN